MRTGDSFTEANAALKALSFTGWDHRERFSSWLLAATFGGRFDEALIFGSKLAFASRSSSSMLLKEKQHKNLFLLAGFPLL